MLVVPGRLPAGRPADPDLPGQGPHPGRHRARGPGRAAGHLAAHDHGRVHPRQLGHRRHRSASSLLRGRVLGVHPGVRPQPRRRIPGRRLHRRRHRAGAGGPPDRLPAHPVRRPTTAARPWSPSSRAGPALRPGDPSCSSATSWSAPSTTWPACSPSGSGGPPTSPRATPPTRRCSTCAPPGPRTRGSSASSPSWTPPPSRWPWTRRAPPSRPACASAWGSPACATSPRSPASPSTPIPGPTTPSPCPGTEFDEAYDRLADDRTPDVPAGRRGLGPLPGLAGQLRVGGLRPGLPARRPAGPVDRPPPPVPGRVARAGPPGRPPAHLGPPAGPRSDAARTARSLIRAPPAARCRPSAAQVPVLDHGCSRSQPSTLTAAGPEHQVPADRRVETEPADGQDPEQVGVGHAGHIARAGPDPGDDPVDPDGHLLRPTRRRGRRRRTGPSPGGPPGWLSVVRPS